MGFCGDGLTVTDPYRGFRPNTSGVARGLAFRGRADVACQFSEEPDDPGRDIGVERTTDGVGPGARFIDHAVERRSNTTSGRFKRIIGCT